MMIDDCYHMWANEYRKLGVTPDELRKTIKRLERKLLWLKVKDRIHPSPSARCVIPGLEGGIEIDKKILKAMEGEQKYD